jgi:hypothetical protein
VLAIAVRAGALRPVLARQAALRAGERSRTLWAPPCRVEDVMRDVDAVVMRLRGIVR